MILKYCYIQYQCPHSKTIYPLVLRHQNINLPMFLNSCINISGCNLTKQNFLFKRGPSVPMSKKYIQIINYAYPPKDSSIFFQLTWRCDVTFCPNMLQTEQNKPQVSIWLAQFKFTFGIKNI